MLNEEIKQDICNGLKLRLHGGYFQVSNPFVICYFSKIHELDVDTLYSRNIKFLNMKFFKLVESFN